MERGRIEFDDPTLQPIRRKWWESTRDAEMRGLREALAAMEARIVAQHKTHEEQMEMRDKVIAEQEARIVALEGVRSQADLHLQSALSALGTGKCSANGCEGCKADSEAAKGAIEDARALLAKPRRVGGDGGAS